MNRLSHKQRAMAEMMEGKCICQVSAWAWDDTRLSATIYTLIESGVPINSIERETQNPITSNVIMQRHYFIDFDLLGDEEAAIAHKIRRELDKLERAYGQAAMADHYIAKLRKLGWKPSEEQLELL